MSEHYTLDYQLEDLPITSVYYAGIIFTFCQTYISIVTAPIIIIAFRLAERMHAFLNQAQYHITYYLISVEFLLLHSISDLGFSGERQVR